MPRYGMIQDQRNMENCVCDLSKEIMKYNSFNNKLLYGSNHFLLAKIYILASMLV